MSHRVMINGGNNQAESDAEVRTIVATQAEEFCSLKDSHSAIDYASLRKFEWCYDQDMRQAWFHVEKISEYFEFAAFPTNLGGRPIALIADKLGANVAVKLYRYYLSQCEGIGIQPNHVLTPQELRRIIK